jgi:hypothetical protein
MRHITSCSGQRVALLSDDGPSLRHGPSKKRTRREPNGRARARPHKCLTHSLTQFTPLAAGCCSRPLVRNLRSHGMPHESPVPGGRRMECLTVELPHHCPCGQATTAYSLRSGHEVCRIGTSPAAYFLSPSSMLRRQSCQSHQSRQSPFIHARRASNGHGQPPPPAPV